MAAPILHDVVFTDFKTHENFKKGIFIHTYILKESSTQFHKFMLRNINFLLNLKNCYEKFNNFNFWKTLHYFLGFFFICL